MSLESAYFVQMPPEKLRGFFTPIRLDEVEQMDVFPALRLKMSAIDVGFVAHETPELILPAYGIGEKDISRALHDQLVKLGAHLEQLGAGQGVDIPIEHGLLLLPGLGKRGVIDLISGLKKGGRLDGHSEAVALDVGLSVMHEVFEPPSLPRLALHHGFAGQPIQYLEQLPAGHFITAQQLRFKKVSRYVAAKYVVDHAKVKVFERITGERECCFLNLPCVLFQKVATIGFLDGEIPLSEQGKNSSYRRARNTKRLRERLLTQRLTGFHRTGANHVDDAWGQLQGEVFLDHRFNLEWLASVRSRWGRYPQRTGVGKYHMKRMWVSAQRALVGLSNNLVETHEHEGSTHFSDPYEHIGDLPHHGGLYPAMAAGTDHQSARRLVTPRSSGGGGINH